MAATAATAIFGPKLAEKLDAALGQMKDLVAATQALKAEYEFRRRLQLAAIPWDRTTEEFTVAAGDVLAVHILHDEGTPARDVVITEATAGAAIRLNGSPRLPVQTADLFEQGIVYSMVLDNTDGSGDLKAVAFLYPAKAAGGGAWA